MRSSLLPTLLFALAGLPAHAQPVLGPGALNPLPGESYTVYFCDYIIPGFGGPNQTWDFTAIACTPELPGTYEDPAGNPWFPTATVMFDDVYLEGNSTALLELGYSAPGPDLMTCTDPLQLFVYPMTYGDQFTDNLDCDRSGAQMSHRSGSATVTADGYGTVILPNGTFPDCLRIHEDRTYTDVEEVPGNTTYFHRDYYHFVQPGIKRPLVSILQTTWSINGGAQGSGASASMLVDVSTGITSAAAQQLPIVWPNPASSSVTFDLPPSASTGTVEFFDARGASCGTRMLNGTGPRPVDISALPTGIYVCRVRVEGSVRTTRLNVMR
ncbi:MAG: T9SS type A sorting domain-containing protein [Flavobacteriales bacterium]